MFATEDVPSVARAAKRLGYKVLSQEPANQVLVVETGEKSTARARQVRELSAAHGVRYIRERPVRRTSNNVATGLMGNRWTALAAKGPALSGQGEIIAGV